MVVFVRAALERLQPALPTSTLSQDGKTEPRAGITEPKAGNTGPGQGANEPRAAPRRAAHPPQAPDTRALFRNDRQYATVTPMPSNIATEPPTTATPSGAAIQNPA